MKKGFLFIIIIGVILTGCIIRPGIKGGVPYSPTRMVWDAEYYAKAPGTDSTEIWLPQETSNNGFTIPNWAETLTDQIQRVKEMSGAPKVNIVAHSMGGLVARYAFDIVYPDRGFDLDVEVVMTFATPHLGIPWERESLDLAKAIFTPDEHPYPKDVNAMRFDSEIMTTLNPTKDRAETRIPKINSGVPHWYSYGADGLDPSILPHFPKELQDIEKLREQLPTINLPMDGGVTILESYLFGAENYVYYANGRTIRIDRKVINGETTFSYDKPQPGFIYTHGMLHGKPGHILDPENGDNIPDNISEWISGLLFGLFKVQYRFTGVSRYENISDATKSLIKENIIDKNDYPIIFVHGAGVWAGEFPNSWSWMAIEIADSYGYINQGIIY